MPPKQNRGFQTQRGHGRRPQGPPRGQTQGRPQGGQRPMNGPPRDKGFADVVKQMYKLVQLLHHLSIMLGQKQGSLTKGFQTKERDLKRFMKPACPSQELSNELERAARGWVLSATDVLINHYEQKIRHFRSLISSCSLLPPEFDRAKQIATGWARKNFGKKLKESSLNALTEITQSPTSPTHSNTAQTVNIDPHAKTSRTNTVHRASDNVRANEPDTSQANANTSQVQHTEPTGTRVDGVGAVHTPNQRGREKRKQPTTPQSDEEVSPVSRPPQQKSAKSQVISNIETPEPTGVRVDGAEGVHTPNQSNREKRKQPFTPQSDEEVSPLSQPPQHKSAKSHMITDIDTHNRFEALSELSFLQDSAVSTPTTVSTPAMKRKRSPTTGSSPNTEVTPEAKSQRPSVQSPSSPELLTQPTQSTVSTASPGSPSDFTEFVERDEISSPQLQSGQIARPADSQAVDAPTLVITDSPPPMQSLLGDSDEQAIEIPDSPVREISITTIGLAPQEGVVDGDSDEQPVEVSDSTDHDIPHAEGPSDSNAGTALETNTGTFAQPPSQTIPVQQNRSPPKATYRPWRPAESVNKGDWQLPELTSECLVLGDSNLLRITKSRVPKSAMQICSFPGAKFSNMKNLLAKQTPNDQIKSLILSIGINERDNNPQSTSILCFRKMINAAAKAFPNAVMSVATLQWDKERVTEPAHKNLTALWEGITKCDNIQLLPAIDQSKFKTETHDRSGIHWSMETANEMLDNWVHHLN